VPLQKINGEWKVDLTLSALHNGTAACGFANEGTCFLGIASGAHAFVREAASGGVIAFSVF
jgi:hypothetical protein